MRNPGDSHETALKYTASAKALGLAYVDWIDVLPDTEYTLTMDVKRLQYLMGHSDAGVTMNVYTHTGYEQAAEQMVRVIEFRKSEQAEKLRKSG